MYVTKGAINFITYQYVRDFTIQCYLLYLVSHDYMFTKQMTSKDFT